MKNYKYYFAILFSFLGATANCQFDTKDILLKDVDSAREMSAFTDPLFHKYVLLSANNSKWASAMYPTGIIRNGYSTVVTTNGGKTWQGRPRKLFSETYVGVGTGWNVYLGNNSDPSVVIDLKGNYLMTTLGVTPAIGFGISSSKNQGGKWVLSTTSSPSQSDKPHTWVDNSETSIYKNNIYHIATYSGPIGGGSPSPCGDVKFLKSSDGGVTWSSSVQIPGIFTCYVNLTTDKMGNLYVIGTTGSNLQIAKSTNGGNTFYVSNIPLVGLYVTNASNLNCPSLTQSEWTFIGNPVALSDKSDEINSGNLYIVFAAQNNTKSNYNVFLIKSTDGGITWGSPIEIDSNLPVGKFNFMPWAACDPETGAISVIYYSNKNQAGACNFDVMVSSSSNGGTSWAHTKMNDFGIDFSNSSYVTNVLNGRIGEYNAITSGNGIVYPFWMDTRNTIPQVYTSPFVVPYCDPNAPQTKVLTANYSSSVKEKAVSTISSTSLINAGSKVKFVTGSSIELNPGFITNISSDAVDENYFTAYINEGCSPSIPISKFSAMVNAPLCTGKTIYLKAEDVGANSYQWSGPLGFTSALREPIILNAQSSHSGIYTCVATLPNNSILSTAVEVNVNRTPDKIYIQKEGDVCNTDLPITIRAIGSEIVDVPPLFWKYASISSPTSFQYITILSPTNTLSQVGINQSSYKWPQNPLEVKTGSSISAGYYKAEANNLGCVAETNIIKIQAKPSLSQLGTCCNNTSLSVTNATNYVNPTFVWKDPNNVVIGNTNPILLNCSLISGTYSCTVTTENCQLVNTINITLAPSCFTGISPITKQTITNLEEDVKIYPNPNNGNFNLTSNKNLKNVVLEVISESGQLVFKKNIAELPHNYFVQLPQQIANGYYTLKISSAGNKNIVKKLVVQKGGLLGDGEEEAEEGFRK